MNQPHVHAAVLVSSVFLLRVQSEAMGLEVGMKHDAQKLPPGRHSAFWIESCDASSATFVKVKVPAMLIDATSFESQQLR